MSLYVRIFSMVEDYPSLTAICDCLADEGFEFSTSPGKNEAEFMEQNWKNILFQYDEEGSQIELDRNIINSEEPIFREEKEEFLEALEKVPYGKGYKKAKAIFKDAVQIYAFEIDSAMDEEGWDFLECMLDFICDATDGYVQIDEEGLYDKEGDLLVELE